MLFSFPVPLLAGIFLFATSGYKATDDPLNLRVMDGEIPESEIPRFVARRPGVPTPAAEVIRERGRRTRAGEYPTEFGMLADFIADSRVTDVFVNGSRGVWVDRGSGSERIVGLEPTEAQLRDLAVRLMSLGGRHIDEATPCVDARLDDGIRVHAVLPPISPMGTLLSVRLPRLEFPTMSFLDEGGFFEVVERRAVESLIAERRNLLITGAGGSGNTTWNL